MSITILDNRDKLELKELIAEVGMPENSEPFKQLVTDKDGNAVWEERLAYEIPASEIIWEYATEMPESSTHIGEGITESFAKDLIVGETYRVKVNNDEYSYVAYLDESGLFKAIGTQDDIVRIMQYIDHPELYGYIDLQCEPGAVTISVIANSGVGYKTIDSKWLPEGIGYETDILSETELTMSEEMGGGLLLTPLNSKLVTGDTYTVIYNGTEYRCVTKEFSEGSETVQILGNFDLMMGTGDTGEPFVFSTVTDEMVAEMGRHGMCYALDGAESITLAIHGGVHKIDPKYLPEGIGYEIEGGGEVLAESSLTFVEGEGFFIITIPFTQPIVTGKTYNVIYNGTTYQSTALEINGEVGLGNTGALTGSGDTGEPFVIAYAPPEAAAEAGFYGVCMPLDGAESITLAINGEGKTIHKIDPKYLPEGIGYEIEGTIVEVWPKDSTVANDMNGSYITVPVINNLEVGKEYTVIINDNKYITTAYSITENGQTATAIGAMPPTDETPFIIILLPEPGEVMLQYDGASDEVITAYGKGYITNASGFGPAVGTIQVYTGEEGTIHKIDPKFLPEGIGYEINEGGEEILPTSSCVEDGAYYNISGPYLGFGFDETYVFTYNGKDYTLTTRLYNENIRWTVVGKFNEDDGFEENVPFGIIFAEKENWEKTGVSLSIIPYPQDSEDIPMTLAIRREGNHSVHKIDPKYLPEGIGYEIEGGAGKVILPECSPEYSEEEGIFAIVDPLAEPLMAGETYVVNWNGTEYICTAQIITSHGISFLALGDIYTLTDGELGTAPTGEPFTITDYSVITEGQINLAIGAIDGSTTLTISISKGGGSKIHKIDPKYLPEGIGYEINNTTEILPTTTLSLEEDADATVNATTASITQQFVITTGETYIVNWDGTTCECIAEDGTWSGLSTVELRYDNDDIAFRIAALVPPQELNGEMIYGILWDRNDSTSVTISISHGENTIHKIDPKFLPDNIGGGLPEGAEPYKQLVTDGEGNAMWEDRLTYEFTRVILPETTITQDNSYGIFTPFTNFPVADETYMVVYDGKEYVCKAQAVDSEMVVLGNSAETPFMLNLFVDMFAVNSMGLNLYGIAMSTEGKISFSLSVIQKVSHKVDPKFLPDGIGYKIPDTIITAMDRCECDANQERQWFTKGLLEEDLVAGAEYTVLLDEVEYKTVCKTTDAENAPFVLGNPAMFGGEDTGEHFTLYGSGKTGDLMWFGAYAATVVKISRTVYGEKKMVDPELVPTDAIVQAVLAALGLPVPTAADAGKILRVNAEGKYELVSLPNAEEATF